jgi:RecB family endonuclease NucS
MVHFGFRVPSLKKHLSARTSLKRYVRHSLGFKAPRGVRGRLNARNLTPARERAMQVWDYFTHYQWAKAQPELRRQVKPLDVGDFYGFARK